MPRSHSGHSTTQPEPASTGCAPADDDDVVDRALREPPEHVGKQELLLGAAEALGSAGGEHDGRDHP